MSDPVRSRVRKWIAALRVESDRPSRTPEEIEADPVLGPLFAPSEIRGPQELEPSEGFRRFVYEAQILATWWRRFTIHVVAAAWGEADRTSLPSPLRENLDTRGRAALETQLEDRNYPEHIFVDRSGVRSEGAQVIFSLGPWLFGVAIGAAVGYGVTQVFGGTVAVNSLLGALVFGLMPPMLTRWFDISDPLIMNPGHGDSNVPVWRFVLGKIAAWLPARRIKGPR